MDQAKKDNIRERFKVLDSANVSDVLDTLGYYHQGLHSDFVPFPQDGGRLAGWAYTIRGQMTPYAQGSGDPEKMKACAGVSPGEVTVWSGNGEGICYIGELIAVGLKERGCVGALIDGGVRDVRWLKHHNFPVYARYRTPVQSIGRWKVNGYQVPVAVRGATMGFVEVKPGDFILADEDGAIAIPGHLVEEVLVKTEALTKQEVQIREELSSGLTLADALAKYGNV
jgi:regulator of RNase E activity RraA